LWAKIAQIATLALAVGLGFQPEARSAIETMASSLGFQIETWHFFLFALVVLVGILSFRVALATTPRVRFLQPKVLSQVFFSEILVPVEKRGSGAVQFTPRLYIGDKPFALLTEERKKEFDRTGEAHVGRYNLGGSPKDIVVFTVDGNNKKIRVTHQQGVEEFRFGDLNAKLVVDDGDNTIEKEISIRLVAGDEVHISDGFWGADVSVWGTAFREESGD
jgi:hypothetical protein